MRSGRSPCREFQARPFQQVASRSRWRLAVRRERRRGGGDGGALGGVAKHLSPEEMAPTGTPAVGTNLREPIPVADTITSSYRLIRASVAGMAARCRPRRFQQ